MANTEFNIPAATWSAAVEEISDLLAVVARKGQTVTYGEVVSRVRSVHLEADSHALHHLLGDGSVPAFDDGAPLLSAVVVRNDDGRPGGGFCDLTRRLDFDVESVAKDIFWAGQLEAVQAWWRRR